MRRAPAIALLLLALCACTRAPAPAASAVPPAAASASTSTTVGDVTLQASTVAIADLNEAVAQRYGIDRSQDGLLLLVTVRDAAGNGIDPGDLRLSASAGTLTDPPRSLALRAIQTDGMTDYIGVLHAKAPASVQFRLVAIRGGARADIATAAELYPR